MSRKSDLFRILATGMIAASMYSHEVTKEPVERSEKKAVRPKGLKRFIIEDQEIWALNKKNAMRKFKNLKKMKKKKQFIIK